MSKPGEISKKDFNQIHEFFSRLIHYTATENRFTMRAQFQKVHLPMRSTYSAKRENLQGFSARHYHQELELHYIIKGTGKRQIGDNIDSFSAGEIILIGENLPHQWKFDENNANDAASDSIVLHFGANCLGSFFLSLPEAHLLGELMERAKRGMIFYGETNKRLAELMHSSVSSFGMERIVILLSILSTLSETREYNEITANLNFTLQMDVSSTKHGRITDFITKNYKKDIGLEDVAAVGNMSVTSFCRYFKLATNKTFNEFLHEIRIGHACRMIIENRFPIDVICFECGFKNIANFYRRFKVVTGMTPREYKISFIN